MSVVATSTVPRANLLYTLTSGSLPPGLALSYDGEIIGKINSFGSVGNLDILEALHAEGAEFVTKSSIILPDGPIKEVGEFAVNVELHPEIVKSIKLEVLPA